MSWTELLSWSGSLGPVSTKANESGAIGITMRAPGIRQRSVVVSLTANARTRMTQGAPLAEQFAPTSFLMSRWSVFVGACESSGPAIGKPRSRVTVDAYGWVGSGSDVLYAHCLRRKRLVRTVRIGELTGPCGDLRKSMRRQFLFRPVKAGTYRVVFDTTEACPNEDAWVGYKRVVVRRREAVR